MQYRKLLVILMLLCFRISVFAQSTNEISGVVKDQNGNAVFGATIIVKDYNTGAVTNEAGHFSIMGNFRGQLELETSFLGYKTKKTSLDLEAEKHKDLTIHLEELATDLETVNISAKSKIQQIEALAYNIEVIDAKKLHNTTLDIGHALDRVSGIRIREDGGVGSRMNLSMNGFRGNQVKIFIDGIPMENFGSSFQLNNIPINLAERIEVYKGVVPVGLGADALGGAVNIVTNTFNKNHLDVSYSYGSFNTHRSNLNAVFVNKSGFTVQLNAFQNYSDNDYKVNVDVADLQTGEYFPNEEVKRFNDEYHNETFIGNIGVVNKSYADRLLLGITLGQNYREIQTGARQVSVYGERHTRGNIIMPSLKYQKKNLLVEGLDVNLNANYNLGKEKIIDTVHRRYNWFGDYVDYDGPGGERTYTHTEFQNNNGVVTANFEYKINEEHAISLSNVLNTFDRERKNLLNAENDLYEQPQKSNKNVLGLGYKFEKEDWSITGFVKDYKQVNIFEEAYNPTGDYGDVAYRHKKDRFNDFGYGFAGTYFLTEDLQVKASFEKSYRLPEPNELYGDGGILFEGNTSLKPESSYNYNLGASYWFNFNNLHHINLSANGFYRDSKDFIRPVLNQNQVLQVMDNLADVTNLGVETEVRYSFKDKFSAGANLTYQNLRNNTKYVGGQTSESVVYRDRIPNIPYFYGNADASYNFKSPFNKSHPVSVGYNLLYVHAFYLYWPSLGSTKLDVPEQVSHDMNITYNFGEESNFQLTVECRNIFDKKLYDNFSLQKPGRNFTGKIRYSF